MRFFLISFILVMAGCASYPKKNGFEKVEATNSPVQNPYFSDTSIDYVYKAKIDVFDTSFGGILVVKKLGPASHRIAFTTEMGNTLFDFSFIEDHFTVNSILKDLDRKILINILRKDFTALIREQNTLQEQYQKNDEYLTATTILGKKHFYLYENDHLARITRIGKGIPKVVFQFSQINDNIAHQIKITHSNFKLTIALNAIMD